MNIFVLDNDPRYAAEYMCDKHIPKMILETFQMMGSALRRHGARDDQMPITQSGKPLIGGYRHHPCTIWGGDSVCNFIWLGLHGISLCEEYTNRYSKVHSCDVKIRHMCEMMDILPNLPQTPYALAMPDEYKSSNAIDSYRRYYIMEKLRFAKWEKGREAPYWWNKENCYETNVYI